MTKNTSITQESFDTLLAWLDASRDVASQKYEKIRGRLIQIFSRRGCFEAEDLADETINRVTLKLPQVMGSYSGDPVLYFYGVAHNIHLEWLRKQRTVNHLPFTEINRKGSENETEYECLETCLDSLPDSDRTLIVEYYRGEKSAKIEIRKALAKNLGYTVSALQVKAFRIRNGLKGCLQNCLSEKDR
jgi:RNA polymerase sigma factor (sigma-70 family)